jgi:hypothetical protein
MRLLKAMPVSAICCSPAPRVLAFLAMAVVGAACSESSAPPPPASVAADNTTIADGTAGLLLTTSPSFVVKDANGNTLGDVNITVAVTAGGGTLTGAPTKTRGGGPTSVGQWKLGNTAGVNTITVTVSGLPPLVISVNGRAGPPAAVALVSGGNQSALAGTALPTSPVVQVRDQFGNGVSGIGVTFSVIDGGGTVSSTPVTTDASGNATAPQWRLGKSAVSQMMAASVPGFSVSVSATVSTSYNAEVRFFGPPMNPAAASAFTDAAARIRGSIVGDQVDIQFPAAGIDLSQCNPGPSVVMTELVDDVIVYASVLPIDGAGKVLGRAGPCFVRSTGRQPIIGVMQFDSDDIQTLIDNNRLRDVIQHEMLHVVGFGTIWGPPPNYNVLTGAGTSESRFTGALGVNACIAIGGATVCPGFIPVENTGGPGTADGHWRESVFGPELMTGFLGTTNPFSVMSIESLADIGYVVNPAAADPYVIPGTGAVLLNSMGAPQPAWEETMRPKFEVTRSGRITRVEKQ